MSTFLKFSGILILSMLAFSGVYLLKITLNKLIPLGSEMQVILRTMPQILLQSNFWLAIGCYVAAMMVYLFLLQSDQVSRIFSVAVGINVVLTALGSIIFLGDTIDTFRVIGIVLIASGVFLINVR
jgi:multidrug transporter EmrE-like cation transporter